MPVKNSEVLEEFAISILIVDDDPLFRRYLANVVEKLGYSYTVLEDPHLILKYLSDQNYSIIIANMYLQGLPGLDLLNTIIENYPGKDVILMTSAQDNYSLTDVISRGAVDFLCKPFTLDEVRAKLSRIVRERKLIHELVAENKKRLSTEEALRKSHILLEQRVLERTKKLEEAKILAEAASELQSEFIANISHELRTPIHGILSFARLGRNRIDDLTKKRIVSYFDAIIDSGERLYTLLTNLLDLSKLEAAMMDYNFQNHCVFAVVQSSVNSIKAAAEEKKVTIICENDADSSIATLDVSKITQVIQNLVINAIKYTKPQSVVSIHIKNEGTSEYGTNNNFVVVTISDEGVGIPPAELEIIFDKFKQSSRTKSGAGGTGLGLAICKQIIHDHKGNIWAENMVEGGTRFCFKLPSNREGLPGAG